MDTPKQVKELEEFLKMAFCIDGECNKRGFDKLVSKNGDVSETLTFTLTDSKRGKFIVSMCTIP